LLRNFKTKLCAIIAIAVCTTIGTGCSNSKTSPSDTAAKSSDKTKIKVWTANRSDAQYAQDKVKNFNDTNKDGIEIEYSIYSDNYQQTLELAFATNEAPDIFFDTGDFFAKFVDKGYFADINKYLTPEYKQRFGDGGFIEGINVIGGKTYSLPAIGTTPRLIYNKDIFKKAGIAEPPKSIEDMVKYSKEITNKLKGEGIYGFAANLKSPAGALTRSVIQILERSGVPVKEGFDFSQGKYDFTPYKPILNAYKEILTSGAAFPGCEALDIDPLRTQFANGKIGMYISWTHSEPAVYKNQFQTKENWDMAPLPTIDGKVNGSQDINLSNKWLYVSGKSNNQDKAWKVMQMFYSDEYLAGYYENGLSIITVPSALKIAKVPETVQKIPALAFDAKDQTWPSIPAGVTPEGQNYAQVFSAIIFGADKNIDSSLENLNKRYNDAYDKAVADGKTKKIQYAGFDPANPGKSISK
jgi:multiple sugar transport system substrate-binding protein